MFESEMTNVLVSGATTLLYIAGLVGFVAWLKSRDVKHQKIAAVASGGQP
jgi:hypothetical protein